jgi:phage tail sheath protein FI
VPDSDFPPHPSFRFALVDVPQATDPIDFRRNFDATRAAIHWPWAGVYDPLGPAGAVRFVPPSGHVAGSFAAIDLALGPHHSAANSELTWIVDLALDVDSAAQALLNDEGVNVIRALPNRGIRIYGARTLASDASWLYVPVRRLMSMIESAVLGAMQWAVFEANTPTLRALVRRSCLTLLETLWQRGAFAGASRDEAYYVICDGTNNPPAAQANGRLQVDIGIAAVRPAEFIIFRVGHQHDTLEVFEGAAA